MFARIIGLCLVLFWCGVVLGQPAPMRGSPALPSYAGDASLHGVFFLDPDLGWACGDRGTILVTVDGGAKWDVVATGHEGTLRHIHFFDAEHGIALGGRSVSLPGQSQALILESLDGGRSWKRNAGRIPAIAAAGFFDKEHGWAVGDCSAGSPSGFFRTRDGGATWTSAEGATPGPWLCGAFVSEQEGILAGYEAIAARTTAEGFAPLDLALGKRVAMRAAAALPHGQAIVAGERGAAFRLRRGKAPQLVEPRAAERSLPVDYQALYARGEKIWLAGSPGAAVFHSADGGQTWTSTTTGQAAPIRGFYFLDDERGFAVGDLGLVLATRDGGQTWRAQRRPGQNAAYLGVFSDAKQIPWELVARISGQEGHYGYVICVASHAHWAGAVTAHDSDLVHRAAARLGGIGGTVLPDYPLAERGAYESLKALEAKWKSGDAGARERLERDLVRQIQIWRPEVIFTELPPSSDGDPASLLTSQGVLSAVAAAARTSAESDELLSPWQVKRVYAVQSGRRGFKTVESAQLSTRLGRSLQEAAWPARRECAAEMTLAPEIFGLQLLLDHTDNDATRSDLFSGIRIEAGGPRRRTLTEPTGSSIESTTRRAMRHHDVIKLLREAEEILRPEEIKVARLVKALDGLDGDFSASALYEMGRLSAERGNREEAIAAFGYLSRGLTDHVLGEDATSQVFALRHGAERLWKDKETAGPSILPMKDAEVSPPRTLGQTDPRRGAVGSGQSAVEGGGSLGTEVKTVAATAANATSQDLLSLLSATSDARPATRFMAAALQRNSTDPTMAFDFYRSFAKERRESALAPCAELELWLAHRRGKAPKRTHSLRLADQRPYLDGKLDEAIWSDGGMALTLDGGREAGSRCWLARDREFLYFAARCFTGGKSTSVTNAATRDVDDPRRERVELLLDVDRDWSTFFRLAIFADGSTLDASGGDLSWNPKWFSAVHLEKEAWCVECAIPLSALGPYGPEAGDAWGMGLMRRSPERPLESWTHPATAEGYAAGFGVLLVE